MTTDRLRRLLLSTCIVALTGALAGCASEPEQRQEQEETQAQPQPQPQQRQAVEVEEPTPEELANTPCGNPDWAQLPPGAEGKAPNQPESQRQESGDDAAEEAPGDADEQSNNVDLYPSEQPCT